ncbi:uncharacterized protein LOC105439984 [Strongylocentrotus purpuratus]|uniref:Uncharacterized protein n=1 Tax=Strongylocentrotus purpuratus TaxID=7668 RepID=A0A7M7NGW9_STRPU|nr:uncharacterized protein LOC105439984 [Strongylocentrotus purpuratus]
MILSNTGTIPPIPTSDPTNKQMDQGDNAEIAQEHPPSDSKSTTSYCMDLKPIPRTDDDDYVSPSFTRKESEAVYVNKDMTEENAVQNDQDNGYVSPSFTRKEFETVFVKTDMKEKNAVQNDPDNDYVSPCFTRKKFEPVYVNYRIQGAASRPTP